MVFIVIFLVLAIGGRWACSAICPLGIIQEVIFQIPFPKKLLQLPYEKVFEKNKVHYFFCIIVFIPIVFLPNKENWREAFLFIKVFGFTTIFILSLFIYRPFCKYFCPFGVCLGFFQKISPFRYKVELLAIVADYANVSAKWESSLTRARIIWNVFDAEHV